MLLQASGNTAAQALGIAAMPLLTRLYAPSDFAALNLFSQAVAMLTIMLTARFEYLVMLPKDDAAARAVFRLVVATGGSMAAVWTALLVWMPWGSGWLATQGALGDWLWLAPVSAWAVSVSVALQQRVQRAGDFRSTASSEFASRCAYVATCLLGALALPNVIGLMAATFAAAAAKAQWLLSRLRRSHAPAESVTGVPRGLMRLAAGTSVSAAITIATGMVTMVFIADVYGSNSLGQYGLVASTLYLPTTLLGQAIGQVYYQRASALHANGQPFVPTLVATSRKLAVVSAVLFSAVAFASPWAYPFVFGQAWREAGELARWLSLAAAVGFVSTPIDRTSLIVNAWWYQTAWHLARTATTVLVLAYVTWATLPLISCVALLSIQTAVLYGLDWLASWWLAARDSTASAQGGNRSHHGGAR